MTRCTKWYASEELMNQKQEMRALNEEQVGRQLIASVFLLTNEVELSIYRFLTSDTKNAKKWPCPVKLRFKRLTKR